MNEELKQEVLTFLSTLDGREKAESWEIKQLFNYHNQIFPNGKEHGTYCPACVARVYTRMKNWRTGL